MSWVWMVVGIWALIGLVVGLILGRSIFWASRRADASDPDDASATDAEGGDRRAGSGTPDHPTGPLPHPAEGDRPPQALDRP